MDRALKEAGEDETLTATIRRRVQREEAKHKVRRAADEGQEF